MQAINIIKYDFNLKKETNSKDNLIIAVDPKNNSIISKYSDNVWDFTLINYDNKSLNEKIILNFNKTLSNGKTLLEYEEHLECLKDFCYLHLIEGFKTTSILIKYKSAFSFIDYIITKNILTFNKVDISHINNYIKSLSSHNISYSTYKNKLLFLKNFFYEKRTTLKYKLEFDPFPDGTFKSLVGRKCKVTNSEQTAIIDDEKWKEIILYSTSVMTDVSFNKDLKKLNKFCIDDYDYEKTNQRLKRRLYFHKGLTDTKFNLPTFNFMLNDIMIAAGIIIQAFTGMRISELLSLKRGCVEQIELNIDGKIEKINKINGMTFKYQKESTVEMSTGKETFWYAPDIVVTAINTIESINYLPYYIFEQENLKTDNKDLLFLSNFFSASRKPIINNIGDSMKDFLLRGNIDLNFKFSSHCFRRTLARFFARNLIGLQVDVLKEQFKHFSKDITLYYMKEDLKSESSYQDIMAGYLKSDSTTPYEAIDTDISKMIMSANNADELRLFVNGKHINTLNEFLLNVNDDKILSPIQSLTCEGVIILPDLHLEYWQEMDTMYEQLLLLEPNSIWYHREILMVKDVIKTLKTGNAYIVKGDVK